MIRIMFLVSAFALTTGLPASADTPVSVTLEEANAPTYAWTLSAKVNDTPDRAAEIFALLAEENK